jgi:hypothetical protein
VFERTAQQSRVRYGGVLVLGLAVVLVLAGSPPANGSRAVALTLEFGALVVVVLTSRERELVRRRHALVLAAAAAAFVILVTAGAIPVEVTFAVSAVLSIVIPASLAGGLVRLVRKGGVTLQVVAGAVAFYLFLGLTFAFVITFVAKVETQPYFAQAGNHSINDCVYFSFVSMTTTGYGDLTAAHGFGRALAVLELLAGQLYLVTVIGVLIGNIAGGRREPADAGL